MAESRSYFEADFVQNGSLAFMSRSLSSGGTSMPGAIGWTHAPSPDPQYDDWGQAAPERPRPGRRLLRSPTTQNTALKKRIQLRAGVNTERMTGRS